MKITLTAVLILLCISLLLFGQDYLAIENSNLETINDLEVEICSDVGNPPTSDEKSEAKRLITELLSTNDVIGIEYYAENGSKDVSSEQQKQTATAIIKMIIPWAVLLVISLLTYFTLMVCCSDCCPCGCCKCNEAKEVHDIKVPLTFTLIFNFIIVAFCIAGLAMSAQFGESLRYFRCTGIKMFADINDGNIVSGDPQISKWQGLNSVIKNMSKIGTDLDQLLSNTDTLLQGIDAEELKQQYKDLLNENKKLANINFPGSYYQINNALAFLAIQTPVSDTFIQAELKEQTIVPQTQLFDAIYSNIINQIASIKSNGQSLSDDRNSIKSALNQAQTDVTDVQTNLYNSAKDFSDGTDNVESGSKAATYLFYIIYGVFCLFAVLSIVAAIFICGNKALSLCKCTMVASCLLYFIFLIIGFVLSAGLATTSGILAETCNYMDLLLTNETKFTSINQVVDDKQVKDIMTECLFGEGDILASFDVYASIKQITDLDSSISAFIEYKTQFDTAKTNGNTQLSNNQAFINSFSNFQRVDIAEPAASDQTHIKYIMREQIKTCNNNKKSSVPDKMSYCDSSAYQYQPLVDKSFSPTATQPVCIQSAAFTLNRTLLDQQIPSCSYLSQIDAAVAVQQNLWQTAVDQENAIVTKHKSNQQILESKFDKIIQYTTEASNYLKQITDTNSGALSGVNCKFVSFSIQRLQDGMCVKTLRIVYYFWIFFAIISISFWLSAISVFRVSIGIYYIRKAEKYQNQELPTQTQVQGVVMYQPQVQPQNGGDQIGYQYQPAQPLILPNQYQQVANTSQQQGYEPAPLPDKAN